MAQHIGKQRDFCRGSGSEDDFRGSFRRLARRDTDLTWPRLAALDRPVFRLPGWPDVTVRRKCRRLRYRRTSGRGRTTPSAAPNFHA